MTRSYTGQILQLAEIPEYVFSHPGERTEVAKTIRNALYELCYGLKGTAINAYESACSIEGGDKEWKETGTLTEFPTKCRRLAKRCPLKHEIAKSPTN